MHTPDLSQARWRKSSRSNGNGNACVEVAFVPTETAWHKSSRSNGNGNACVEVAFVPAETAWRKSSRSNGSGNQCVEVARSPEPTGVTGLRDSKNPAGGVLVLPAAGWRQFRSAVTTDR